MCITWSICGGAHPAALGSNSFFLDHHQFLGKSCLHNASSSGLGRNGRAFCGFQVTTVMRILRRDGLDGQQDILFLSLLSWCFTLHKSLHVLSLLFLFFFSLQILHHGFDPEVCFLAWSFTSQGRPSDLGGQRHRRWCRRSCRAGGLWTEKLI